MRSAVRAAPALAVVLVLMTGCGGAVPISSPPSASASPTPSAAATSVPESEEPVAVEPGTYQIEESAWSVADFTVTLPDDWTVQYGHVFAKHADTPEEFGFYAVVPDEIYADACKGSTGQVVELGSGVDELAAALLEQAGPKASGAVETTLGGYPATRIDLSVPEGFNLEACNLGSIGLQIWYSRPADKNFVLLADGMASAYIVDVDGQRQVFLTQNGPQTSDEDLRELQAVLNSIRIET